MKTKRWDIEWVDDMPSILEPGIVYIAVRHRLTEHVCACGCGEEVSLPLGRSEWKLAYDGESISLWPSIGNWRLPCKSHYLIRESNTVWCNRWNEREILAGREKDRYDTQAEIKQKNLRVTFIGRILARIGLIK